MSGQFEFVRPVEEQLFVVEGAPAEGMMRALFGSRLPPGQLVYRTLPQAGDIQVAACWLAPDRLEIRVMAAAAAAMKALLISLASPPAETPFQQRVRQLIVRLEAWSYADSDPGLAPAESMARELRTLGDQAPGAGARRVIAEARDALDDGLPAEVIVGLLERALDAVSLQPPLQASGLDPSTSG
ncbi:MAG: hypothetical protein PVSMB9_01290 [Candidatus Dormibacteria bacterium]